MAKAYGKKSNAVSVSIGAQIKISSLTLLGSTGIKVKGAGFSSLTVINFFNTQAGGKVVNLGGLTSAGTPRIPILALFNENDFNFAVPPTAAPGPSYVQVLNPPYVPFTSSGDGPSGVITLP